MKLFGNLGEGKVSLCGGKCIEQVDSGLERGSMYPFKQQESSLYQYGTYDDFVRLSIFISKTFI